MTLQPRPSNPIQHRKDQVRKHSRNAAICVGGGIGGGLLVGFLLSHSMFWVTLGLIIAVVGGGWNALRINQIINHKD
ncbi:hypothetical protein [Corynebacterium tapiri]|uniref:Uncharacterized protein n=1 Tax=Corynebacterium tapiri TaxID=1448266 RepID=A0A5C4U654_9CORY|nr:hypothetical protein [Corynebacterium tapiri]TNL99372.1 hypothetical protein FHE74_03170 [Corynebacterium tapiri]